MKPSLLFAVLLLLITPSLAQDCACETAPLPEFVLSVNGKRFRQADIFSATTQKNVTDLQQSVIDERKNEVQLLINSKLLAAEARKRGMSATRLIKQELSSKVADPTDNEIQEFYNRNRGSIAGDLNSARSEIIAYIRNRRERTAAESFAQQLRSAADVKILVDEASPPASAAQRSRVLATINAIKITSGDVEDALRPTIFSVQQQVYDIRKGEIERKINDTLLADEAIKRGVSQNELYEAEVSDKVTHVTEAQAKAFFDQNKERINGEFVTVKAQLIDYLTDKNKKDAEQAFAKRLRDAANIQIFLPEPIEPVYFIETEGRPSKGPKNAAVTVVEFTDIECRTCAEPHDALERIFNEANGKMRLVIMHYPLSQHKNARTAAEAAEAALEQGRFFEYVDLLFKNQSALDLASLKQYASRLGLDRKKFDAALDGARLGDLVDNDRLEGDRLGVSRTPTIYINGRRNVDITYEGLKKAIEAGIKK